MKTSTDHGGISQCPPAKTRRSTTSLPLCCESWRRRCSTFSRKNACPDSKGSVEMARRILFVGCLVPLALALSLPTANGGHRRSWRNACCQPQPCAAQDCGAQQSCGAGTCANGTCATG